VGNKLVAPACRQAGFLRAIPDDAAHVRTFSLAILSLHLNYHPSAKSVIPVLNKYCTRDNYIIRLNLFAVKVFRLKYRDSYRRAAPPTLTPSTTGWLLPINFESGIIFAGYILTSIYPPIKWKSYYLSWQFYFWFYNPVRIRPIKCHHYAVTSRSILLKDLVGLVGNTLPLSGTLIV
jgi:hypothetical protein